MHTFKEVPLFEKQKDSIYIFKTIWFIEMKKKIKNIYDTSRTKQLVRTQYPLSTLPPTLTSPLSKQKPV